MHTKKSFHVFGILFGLVLFVHSCGSDGNGPPTLTDINGGVTGSGTIGSLFIIDGNNFGDLTSTPSDGYSVDFRNPTTDDVVASAKIDFENKNWTNVYIVGTVPNGLTAGTTYKVSVTTPGGTSNELSFLIVSSVSFSPSTIVWTATASLPTAQQGFSSVTTPIGTTTYIYALGGNTSTGTMDDNTSNVDTVYYNSLNKSSGALAKTSWSSTTALPAKRSFAAAGVANEFNSLVTGNGYVYVLGGLDGTGKATSKVYYSSIKDNGTLPASGESGTWDTTTALPQALFAEGAVIFHGRFYVVGGNNSSGKPISKVYSADIKSDGTLGSWQTLVNLPAARAYHQLVVSAGYLYVLGGDSAAVDPISQSASTSKQSTVYYNQINIRDGSLVGKSWTANSSGLTKSREKFTATVAGSYILVSGGLYSGSPGSSEQSYAQIKTDGSLSSFNGATGSHTISGTGGGYSFFNQATAYFVDKSGNPHVLILGGEDANDGSLHDGCWYQH